MFAEQSALKSQPLRHFSATTLAKRIFTAGEEEIKCEEGEKTEIKEEAEQKC